MRWNNSNFLMWKRLQFLFRETIMMLPHWFLVKNHLFWNVLQWEKAIAKRSQSVVPSICCTIGIWILISGLHGSPSCIINSLYEDVLVSLIKINWNLEPNGADHCVYLHQSAWKPSIWLSKQDCKPSIHENCRFSNRWAKSMCKSVRREVHLPFV